MLTSSFLLPALTVHAETLNQKQMVNVTKNEMSTVRNTNTDKLMTKLQKDAIKPGSKLVKSKTVYLRIDKNDATNIKQFTQKQYDVQLKKEKIEQRLQNQICNFEYVGPNGIQSASGNKYAWIELKLEVYVFQGQYTAYGYYQWKTMPNIWLKDQIAIKGSGVSFDYRDSSLQYFSPEMYDPYASDPGQMNYQSNGMVANSNGVSYQFPMIGYVPTAKVNPYGVITVPIDKLNYNQYSADLVLEYLHEQIPFGITPGLSVGSLGISSSQWNRDVSDVGIQINF